MTRSELAAMFLAYLGTAALFVAVLTQNIPLTIALVAVGLLAAMPERTK